MTLSQINCVKKEILKNVYAGLTLKSVLSNLLPRFIIFALPLLILIMPETLRSLLIYAINSKGFILMLGSLTYNLILYYLVWEQVESILVKKYNFVNRKVSVYLISVCDLLELSYLSIFVKVCTFVIRKLVLSLIFVSILLLFCFILKARLDPQWSAIVTCVYLCFIEEGLQGVYNLYIGTPNSSPNLSGQGTPSGGGGPTPGGGGPSNPSGGAEHVGHENSKKRKLDELGWVDMGAYEAIEKKLQSATHTIHVQSEQLLNLEERNKRVKAPLIGLSHDNQDLQDQILNSRRVTQGISGQLETVTGDLATAQQVIKDQEANSQSKIKKLVESLTMANSINTVQSNALAAADKAIKALLDEKTTAENAIKVLVDEKKVLSDALTTANNLNK